MNQPRTLYELLRDVTASHADDVALEMTDADRSVTYGEFSEQVADAAAGLLATGLRRGDSIALWLPNSVEWVVLQFAAARLGILVVPLNTRYKVGEVAHLVGVGGAQALIFSPDFHRIDFAGMVEQVLAELPEDSPLRLLVTVDRAVPDTFDPYGREILPYADLLGDGGDLASVEPGRPDDGCTVFGTSGTTSYPKLACHDQKTITRHVCNAAAATQMGADDRTLCFLPFCGTFGFVALLATLAAGGTAVVQPVYGHEEAVELIRSREVTILFATEAICRGLFGAPNASAEAFRSWTRGIAAGVSIRELVDRGDAELDVRIVNVYGSSELFAVMAVWHPDESAEVRATPGGRLVADEMYVRAVDTGTGAVLPDGEYGELEFSGYNLPLGYLANEEANAKAFTGDGWYRSNDRGRVLEDGRAFEYQSRLADTLRLRGYLVSPAEIEEFLVTHEAVEAAQVVGVHDDATGEDRAVAFVQPAPDAVLEPEEARDYCRANLARWKVPELVLLIEDFPTTPSANGDKVQKNRLREMAADEIAARDA